MNKKLYCFIIGAGVLVFALTTPSGVFSQTPTAAESTAGDITICGRPGTDNFNVCYYQGQNREIFKVQRTDPSINFDFGTGSPHPIIAPDNFSARWLGLFDFEEGVYEFTATTDDGMRVFVDNELIIDEWHDQPATTYTVRKTMEAGENRGVIVEYYENTGNAVAKVSWRKISDATTPPPPPAPSDAQFFPSAFPSTWFILPGEQLSFSGSGFAPGETVTIQGDSVNTTATVSAGGNFSANNVLTIPFNWAESSRSFTITGSVSGDRVTPRPITIQIGTFFPQLTPSEWWIGHNQGVSAMVSGFAPGEQVRLLVNGTQTGQAAVNGSGNATFNFTAPGSGGSAMLTAQGLSTGLSVSRTIFLHP